VRVGEDTLQKRAAELRNVCEFLMGDLYSAVLGSTTVSEYVKTVVTTAPTGAGLFLPVIDGGVRLGLDQPLLGRATFGVYPTEVLSSLTAEPKVEPKVVSVVTHEAPGTVGSPTAGRRVSYMATSRRASASAQRASASAQRTARAGEDAAQAAQAAALAMGLTVDTGNDDSEGGGGGGGGGGGVTGVVDPSVERRKEAAEKRRLAGQTNDAFSREEFPPLAAEVLRNTMYNLMQEALYDEFHVLAEPLSFAVKE
jgi:hypothetical protein